MDKVVGIVTQTLTQELGRQLIALYLYGSYAHGTYQAGESDINLVAVVTENTDLQVVRKAFLPIWKQIEPRMRRAPLVVKQKNFLRHLQLNPLLGYHLKEEGQLLVGQSTLLNEIPSFKPQDLYAQLAYETMLVSPILTPELLTPEAEAEVKAGLRSLARRMLGRPIRPQETSVQLFTRIQDILEARIAKLPIPKPKNVKLPSSQIVPGLRAIYRTEGDRLLLALSNLTPQQIEAIDWQKLAQRLAKESSRMYVTTSTQLQIVTAYDRPLDIFLQRYQHEWGLDPLGMVQTDRWRMLRQAARQPSQVLVEELPYAFLTEPDYHKIIHDFQNRMLNIQLENEILYRMKQVERFQAPEPLPDRNEPTAVRLNALFQHLEWWTKHYTNAMLDLA